jgi:membrane protein DedA with SNARE-associated domain
VATVTTVVENQVLYQVALARGPALLHGTDRKTAHLRKVLGWVQKRGALFLFVSRFLVGLRTAAALACGVAQMPKARFFWTNILGAIVWTGVMAAVGWSGGHLFHTLVDDVKRHEWRAAGVLAVTVFLLVTWRSKGWDWRDLTSIFRRL